MSYCVKKESVQLYFLWDSVKISAVVNACQNLMERLITSSDWLTNSALTLVAGLSAKRPICFVNWLGLSSVSATSAGCVPIKPKLSAHRIRLSLTKWNGKPQQRRQKCWLNLRPINLGNQWLRQPTIHLFSQSISVLTEHSSMRSQLKVFVSQSGNYLHQPASGGQPRTKCVTE